MTKEIPKCSICDKPMNWKEYDNPQGGFWSCPSWKVHKDKGEKSFPKFTEHPAAQYMTKPQQPASSHSGDSSEYLKSIMTGQAVMQDEIAELGKKIDVLCDLLKQNLT